MENYFSILCIVNETGVVMDSKKIDLSSQYKQLLEAVNQSSLHTNRQLNTINKNSYIGGCILLVLSLGITYFLNIFEYWIPAGFLLFYFLFFTALRSVREPFVHKDIKDVVKHYKEKHSEIRASIDSCVQKNVTTLMQSLSILYLILFFIMLSIEFNWIAVDQSLDLFIPSMTCLLFLPVPFLIKWLYQFNYPKELKISLQTMVQKRKKPLWKTVLSWKFLNPILFGIYLVILLSLPLISLITTSSIIIQWPYLALIFILQSFIIIFFSNSFSANTVLKELSATITTFADLNYLLSMAQIQNHYTSAEYQRLKTVYESAKPYDFVVKDAFSFINFYLIVPNRFILKEILKHPIDRIIEPLSMPQHDGQKPVSKPIVRSIKPTVKANFANLKSIQPAVIPLSTQPVEQQELKRISIKSKEDLDHIKIGKVGIILYGPMLDNLTKEIKSAMKKRIKGINTPFKVELARKNDSFGGAPELVPVSSGGAQVNGELIVFKDSISEHEVVNMLYRMENHLEGTKKVYRKPSNPSSNVFVIKSLQDFYGVNKVFYPSFGRNINKITPQKLAKLTIDSVFNVEDETPDGFSYLMMLRKYDISTPMLDACEEEILHQTDSNSLWESRKKLERVNEIKANI